MFLLSGMTSLAFLEFLTEHRAVDPSCTETELKSVQGFIIFPEENVLVFPAAGWASSISWMFLNLPSINVRSNTRFISWASSSFQRCTWWNTSSSMMLRGHGRLLVIQKGNYLLTYTSGNLGASHWDSAQNYVWLNTKVLAFWHRSQFSWVFIQKAMI